MANVAKKKDTRSRVWTFVGYPGDSLPEDWEHQLNEMQLTWACSPEHSADVNGDGSEKKNHRHFCLRFPSNKSFDQVKEITDKLKCPIPQPVRNIVKMVRYFLHLDNPDKEQYQRKDIKQSLDFDVDQYLSLTESQRQELLREVLNYCRQNGVIDMCELDDYIADNKPEWFDVTVRYSAHIYRILKSRYHQNVRLYQEKLEHERQTTTDTQD